MKESTLNGACITNLYNVSYPPQHATKVQAYLPHGLWYDWYEGYMLEGLGDFRTLDAPWNKIPLLVRGGSIIPTHLPANTTTQRLVLGSLFYIPVILMPNISTIKCRSG